MKQIVLITGGTGFIGKYLSDFLRDTYELRFLTRGKSRGNLFNWNIEKEYIDPKALIAVDHIVHLAGTSVVGKRWSKKRKEDILSSRVKSAQLILQSLEKNNQNICSFLSASGTGYYGSERSSKTFFEDHDSGNDFLSHVCVEWEKIAQAFKANGIAQTSTSLRIGVVLGKGGGAFSKMSMPVKYYAGSPLGDGKQFMPWIHIDDLCRMIGFCLAQETNGIFNAVAPQHISNTELTNTMAEVMKKQIILPNTPTFILKMIFGEMSTILLNGNKASAQKIIDRGFSFKYDKLFDALTSCLIPK